MSAESVRAFIAVRPSADLRRACADVAAAGRELPMRWVRPESLHLTLRFLGNVAADTIQAIHQALRQAVKGLAPFSVVARGLGCFPGTTRPRVLWMGLDEPRHELLQLHQRIESALATTGIPVEGRPFRPHLTLARALGTPGGEALDAFLNAHENRMFGHLVVSQIHLMRSDLDAKGAVHTRLHSIALRGPSINHVRHHVKPQERGGNDAEIRSCNS